MYLCDFPKIRKMQGLSCPNEISDLGQCPPGGFFVDVLLHPQMRLIVIDTQPGPALNTFYVIIKMLTVIQQYFIGTHHNEHGRKLDKRRFFRARHLEGDAPV